MPPSPAFRPSRAHSELGTDFYDVVAPARFPMHVLRHRNWRWAARIGLDTLTDAEWIAHFGRFEPLPGSLEHPLALRYHGHQFQVYNPELGDGRGFLFAQAVDPVDGRLLDLGTKGSGRTPWSRTADGRLTLKGGVRELLATEMLEALGVDTSKTFSLIETGEELERHDEPSPTRSCVLVRLSHGHVRIGTFQRFAFLGERGNNVRLLDYAVRTYHPGTWRDDLEQRVLAFLDAVVGACARTTARWMAAGFVHGVLNTDNINVTGESFDYGPWRFLPTFDRGFTAAYFDHGGLYAYGRQPVSVLWNLTRLAECFLELASPAELEATLGGFQPVFQRELATAFRERLGLAPAVPEAETALVTALLAFMETARPPFERVLFDWRGGLASRDRAARSPVAPLYASEAFAPVRDALAGFAPDGDAGLGSAYYAAPEPCTMLIDEVESIWAAIAERDDWGPLRVKLDAIDAMARASGTRSG